MAKKSNETVPTVKKRTTTAATSERTGRLEALRTWYYAGAGQKAKGFKTL